MGQRLGQRLGQPLGQHPGQHLGQRLGKTRQTPDPGARFARDRAETHALCRFCVVTCRVGGAAF